MGLVPGDSQDIKAEHHKNVINYGGGMLPGVEDEEGSTGDETEKTAPVETPERNGSSDEEDEQAEGSEDPAGGEEGVPAAPPGSFTGLFGPRIMKACKLTCILLAIVVVVQSRGPLIQTTPPALPFFPRHSLVSDFHTGDIVGLTERLLNADLSLVVYYAPWDRESHALRWEIEKVARYHHEQIYFAAINCWHPTSECRSRYKIRTFPAIVLHVRSASGQETKALAYGGPHNAGHIIRFLSRAMRPLNHVASHSDLARLQIEYSAVVLGYYDFSSTGHLPKGYVSYYLASLRALQHDNIDSIAWGVVTNPRTARALSFNATRSIHIVLWNTTLVFTTAVNADSEGIHNWVMKRLDEPAKWLDVPGTKSLGLSQVFQKGPTLLLFMPDNPYHTANDPFMLLREISLNYKNCDQSSRVTNLANYLGSVRSRGRRQLRHAEHMCRNYLQEQLRVLHMSQEQSNLEDETGCNNQPHRGSHWGEGVQEKTCDVCPHPESKTLDPEQPYCTRPNSREEESSLLQHVNKLMSVFSDSCKELVVQYSPWEHYSVCCQRNSTPAKVKVSPKITFPEDKKGTTAPVGGYRDDRIDKLVAMSAEDQCKRLFHGSLLAPPALLKDNNQAPDITGLGCKSNKTLNFLAVDSLRQHKMAERLGINLTSSNPQNTAVVILDKEEEAHFIMDSTLSKTSLVHFILNYTNGHTDRRTISGSPKKKVCEEGQICIQELTSENYLQVTQEKGKMVVVLHYSGSCASCTTIGHVFMSVAQAAHYLPNVTFARFNVLTNTLQWNLHFHTLPTIIIHPHHRKGDSRIFDTSHQLTPASLMSFLVANLSPTHRLSLAVSACQDQCQDLVLQSVRTTTTRLHHELTASTARLLLVLDKLAGLAQAGLELSKSNQSHYEVLRHMKKLLVKDIKRQRVRLSYLREIQRLFTESVEELSNFHPKDLLKTLNLLMQKGASPAQPKSSQTASKHDE